MKRKFIQIILLLIFSNLSYSQTNIYDSINFNGSWRTYLTHLPTAYNSSITYPLVLAFHGGSPLGYQSIEYQSRLSQKADSAGFIVVYPEGLKVAGNRTWNAGGCCAPATTLNIDDVGYVNSLLNKLFATRPIDTIRVYATGFSNGALLCYRLANQLTNRFAAIAPVAGDLMYYPWNPSRAIPIISFHSYLDQNVKYFGGVTIGTTGTYFPPQDSIFNIISSNYACTILKDTLYHNINQYDHFIYSNCSCNSLIEQYVSYDGEHSWPGGLAVGTTTVSNQFSATYLMWKFFQNYTTVYSTTGIENYKNNNSINIYPNPVKNELTIELKSKTEKVSFEIFNSIGQSVYKGNLIEKTIVQTSNYEPGVYIIKINTDKNTVVKKFVKEK